MSQRCDMERTETPFLPREHVWAERGSGLRRNLKNFYLLFFKEWILTGWEGSLKYQWHRLLSVFLSLNCWVSAYWHYLGLLLRSCLFYLFINKKGGRKGGRWRSSQRPLWFYYYYYFFVYLLITLCLSFFYFIHLFYFLAVMLEKRQEWLWMKYMTIASLGFTSRCILPVWNQTQIIRNKTIGTQPSSHAKKGKTNRTDVLEGGRGTTLD